ncbi:MAG: glutathione S-transferase family protein [Methyloligellaceae bacterium]
MILRSASPSPFGRKTKMAAKILDLMDRIEIVRADLNDPDDSIRQENPLGKIPALVLDDGTCLYDSRVICEYLDGRAGGGRLFPGGEARTPAIRLQALADGLIDAAILQVYEGRYRPEDKHHQPWLDRQSEKVERALAALEADPPAFDGTPHIGHVALACALGYLDFRFAGKWRDGHPNLVAWLDAFAAAVPAYAETELHD